MPDKINLLFALSLTPELMIQYFRSKGYALSWNWEDVWQQQHNQAFTVAKVMKLDLLKDIREIVDNYIAGNIYYDDAVEQLTLKLRAKGWWGKQEQANLKTGEKEVVQLGSPWRVKRILETNMIVANSQGKYKTQIDAVSFAPYWRYRDRDDSRVRDLHRAIGQIFKTGVLIYSHPFWDTWYPPNDWGCRCWVENYTERQALERSLKIYTADEFNESLNAVLKRFGITTPPAEWAYNAGATAWTPDLTQYPPDLIEGVGL
ncbi:MAG: phage minor head protein [Ignavibacteriaceae bacterium]